jgi:NADH dehydrogenase
MMNSRLVGLGGVGLRRTLIQRPGIYGLNAARPLFAHQQSGIARSMGTFVTRPSMSRLLLASRAFAKVNCGVGGVRWNSNEAKGAGRKLRFKETFAGSIVFKTLYYSTLFIGVSASVAITFLALFFVYDATTYVPTEVPPVDVSQAALSPVRGGPKNLPICYSHLDSHESPEKMEMAKKPKLVILGSGWGSVSLLKEIDPDLYDITIVSPSNYFLFTPMLPSATVGTLEFRSLVEPIRRICRRVKAHFLEGSAISVEWSDKLVEIQATDPNTGECRNFYLPYDKLVIGVGSQSNTHGVKGLENCHTLKTVQDARNIRSAVISNLEAACLPTTTEEERQRLLSFVVCGGGPTGVELAAEIHDVLNEDLYYQYPMLLRNQVSIHVIQSRSHILNTYDQKISEYAMERFQKDSIDVQVHSRVKEVLPDRVVYTQQVNGDPNNVVEKELPYGMCIWSTGVAQTEFTKSCTSSLGPHAQTNKRAIETDTHLRVIGAPMGDVYAIGDCSTVRTDMAANIANHLRYDVLGKRRYSITGENRISDEELSKVSLTFNELQDLAASIKRKYPQATEHFSRLKLLFEQFDKDKSGTLSLEELTEMLHTIDKKVTSLPATAQRAHQQGEYLGKKLSRLAKAQETLSLNDIINGDVDDAVFRPFHYRHLGSLAYVSNAAVFDFGGKSYFGGLVAMYLWRGVYFAQTVSFRTRALMFFDWLKRGLFGRDLADISTSYESKNSSR